MTHLQIINRVLAYVCLATTLLVAIAYVVERGKKTLAVMTCTFIVGAANMAASIDSALIYVAAPVTIALWLPMRYFMGYRIWPESWGWPPWRGKRQDVTKEKEKREDKENIK